MSADSKKRILVIDDDAEIRAAMKNYLERKGFLVGGAPGDQVATDLISAANHSALMRYSLIVLDINLDQTNGLDLLEKLREKKIVECPVIVLSGDFDPKDVPRSKALGVVSFLVKPVSGQKLEAAINEALAK